MSVSQKPIYKVLIVEDDLTNREILLEVLRDDYEVYIADTYASALSLLDVQPIDIGLFDIGLPDGNGLDLCKVVKADHEKYGDIHVIFITAMDKPADEVKGLQVGGSDYISKPLNTAVVRARVELQADLIRKSTLLGELARIDGLTEIPNRRSFDDHLEKSWNHAKRINVPLSLVLLDIDYFKQFNDLYGHPAGDACLRQLARCLEQKIKRGSDHFARYGGEEFAILLFDCGQEQARSIAEQVLVLFRSLAIPHAGSQVADVATFSAGVCTAKPTTGNKDDFVLACDKLLYEAKQTGRARVCTAPYEA